MPAAVLPGSQTRRASFLNVCFCLTANGGAAITNRFKTVGLMLAAILASPAMLNGDEALHDALFHIERNTNANIVQYDAQLGANGKLHAKKPVVVYWIRLAEQGQVRKLSWVQRKFAFGFKAKLNEADDTVVLKMALDLDRTITVTRDGEDYRAVCRIDGAPSYIDRVFIHATGRGVFTKVDYIELYGNAVGSGVEQYERFAP